MPKPVPHVGNHWRRRAKLTVEKVTEIRRMATEGIAQHIIAEQFGVAQSTIHKIVHHKTWKEETDNDQ